MKNPQQHIYTLISTYRRYSRKYKRLQSKANVSNHKLVWIKKRLSKIEHRLRLIFDYLATKKRTAVLASGLLLTSIGVQAQTFEEQVVHPLHGIVGETGNLSFVDFDGDQDRDFFIWGYPGGSAMASTQGVTYYENTGSEYQVSTITGFPTDLGLGALLDTASLVELAGTFTDFDQDGDADLFIGASSGEVRFLRNDEGTYTPIIGEEDPFGDFEFPANVKPIFGDIDNDGDIDAILGSTSGIYIFDNNEGQLDSLTELSGELAEASPLLHDFDDDGDLDLLVGNKYDEWAYFTNNEGSFEPAFIPQNGLIFDAYSGLAVEDIDFDNADEFIIADFDGSINVYERTSESQYDIQAFNPMGFNTYATYHTPVFVDFDGDGDEDMFLGQSNSMAYFENVNDSFQLATHPFADQIDDFSYFKPNFSDYDGDGDMDLILGEYGGIEVFTQNDGAYEMITDTLQNPFFKISEGEHQAPAFHDMDGDGDLDLILGNKNGDLEYFINNEGVFEAAETNPFADFVFSSYTSPVFVDIDQDGDMDLVIGQEEAITVLQNDANEFTLMEPQPFNETSFYGLIGPGFYDFDGNGTLDVLAGSSLNNRITYLMNTSEPASSAIIDLSHRTRVFPNPASDQLSLEVDWLAFDDEANVEIYNQLGSLVYSKRIAQKIQLLDISMLESGHYFVAIISDKNGAFKKLTIAK